MSRVAKKPVALAKGVEVNVQPDSISACQSVAFDLTEMSINGVNYFKATEANVRKLPLGAYEEWALLGITGDHPFHVHVNPFQVVSAPTTPELEGVWKDTLLVTKASGDSATPEDVTRVYTHYEDFLGAFVQHCHILDHEDMGMMQKLEVVPPADGSSGTLGACPAECIPQNSGPNQGKCATPASP